MNKQIKLNKPNSGNSFGIELETMNATIYVQSLICVPLKPKDEQVRVCCMLEKMMLGFVQYSIKRCSTQVSKYNKGYVIWQKTYLKYNLNKGASCFIAILVVGNNCEQPPEGCAAQRRLRTSLAHLFVLQQPQKRETEEEKCFVRLL